MGNRSALLKRWHRLDIRSRAGEPEWNIDTNNRDGYALFFCWDLFLFFPFTHCTTTTCLGVGMDVWIVAHWLVAIEGVDVWRGSAYGFVKKGRWSMNGVEQSSLGFKFKPLILHIDLWNVKWCDDRYDNDFELLWCWKMECREHKRWNNMIIWYLFKRTFRLLYFHILESL